MPVPLRDRRLRRRVCGTLRLKVQFQPEFEETDGCQYSRFMCGYDLDGRTMMNDEMDDTPSTVEGVVVEASEEPGDAMPTVECSENRHYCLDHITDSRTLRSGSRVNVVVAEMESGDWEVVDVACAICRGPSTFDEETDAPDTAGRVILADATLAPTDEGSLLELQEIRPYFVTSARSPLQ